MSPLTCPKCHGEMRTYERSGVHVDQCSECRGIFLDRGELEHLIDGEQRWAAAAPQAQHSAPQQREQHHQQQYQQQGKPSKKRKSFFEDLFE